MNFRVLEIRKKLKYKYPFLNSPYAEAIKHKNSGSNFMI